MSQLEQFLRARRLLINKGTPGCTWLSAIISATLVISIALFLDYSIYREYPVTMSLVLILGAFLVWLLVYLISLITLTEQVENKLNKRYNTYL